MVYAILKFLMQLSSRVFFRSITVRNRELIPKTGPLMILSNHPSSFMDPIMLATMLDVEVYFLAKGEFFKSKFAQWLFPKMNMIPVYRQQDDPSDTSKNEETFKKCYEHLEHKGAILLFPEGTSITERKLRPLKTGAARIVLGAEARNNFQLNSQIVTIGLNYTNPHKFNRDLFVNIDLPINVSNFKEAYSVDPYQCVRDLTETIRSKLEKLIIGINDERTDELAKDIESLYKYKLSEDLGIAKDDREAKFNLTKNIVEVVDYYFQNDPDRAEKMSMRIKEYLQNIKSIGLKDYDIQANRQNKSVFGNGVKAFFIIIFGFPIYLFGLINNYLPFQIPIWIANQITRTLEFRGPIRMVAGLFTFTIFYLIQIIIVWRFSEMFWLTLAYAISLPLTGLYAFWYFHFVRKIKAKWLIIMVFYKKSVIVANLINEREQIISEFDSTRAEYALIKG